MQIPPLSPNPSQASALLLLKSGLIDEISAAADDGVAASLPARLPRRSPFEKVKKKQKKPSNLLRFLSLYAPDHLSMRRQYSFQLERAPPRSLLPIDRSPREGAGEGIGAAGLACPPQVRLFVCLGLDLLSPPQRAPSPQRSTINMSGGKQLPPLTRD